MEQLANYDQYEDVNHSFKKLNKNKEFKDFLLYGDKL